MTPDLQHPVTRAEAIAREAGQILRDYYEQARDYTLKGSVDLVTEADKKSEAFILEALKKDFPEYAIVGEEGSCYQPENSSDNPEGKQAEYSWYVDPLDGTTNFAHRMPHFCVSIALVNKKLHPQVGVVYDPLRDECFTATCGGGAFLNGKPIKVSETRDIGKALIATGFPYDRWTSGDNNLKEFGAMLLKAQGMRRAGAAALDLAYVAAGRYDGYWENKLHRWDCLAGILLVEEAGGAVTDYDGRGLMKFAERPQLIATNKYIYRSMQQTIGVIRGNSQILYSDRYFAVEGKEEKDRFIQSGNGIIVVPLTKDNRVIFIRERSPAFKQDVLLLPGGAAEQHEVHDFTANRELQEEIGYKAAKLDYLGEYLPWSKYLQVKVFIYLASDLTRSKLEGDEEYPIHIEQHPLDDFEKLIESERLQDSLVITALYRARKFLITGT